MKFLAVLIATTLVTSLDAQTDRRLLATNVPPRESSAMAYDLAHGRCVLFGGFDGQSIVAATMLWDGRQWTAATPAVAPPARHDHAMAYDLARARVVLFGGVATTLLSDTWEWDGTNWSQARPTHIPPAREYTAMAYSLTTARTVMFGGAIGSVIGDDTWEWDGSDWTRQLFGQGPPARYGHAMAYDLQHDRVVLFGGQAAFGGQSAVDPAITWQYDGFTWTAISTPTHPPALQANASDYHLAMAFDFAANRTLLLQTNVTVTNPNPSVLWSWDGAAWTPLPLVNAQPLQYRRGPALAYDIARTRTVVFGGGDGDTWEWDGSVWHTILPPARRNAAFAFDTTRGAAVLFGGLTANSATSTLADTWEWRDSAWHVLQPTSAPSGRAECGAAFDSLRNVTVLFGGTRSPAEFDETWEWNGSNWNQRASSVRPPARRRPALAFDAARGEVVMFGGFSTSPLTVFQDTWTWNGTTWTQRTPAVQPPPRADAAFAFDAARGRCVLFSGLFLSTPGNDTWEWDGANWIARSPVHAPSARSGAVFTYDAPRRRMVLIGGYGVLDETWEWDGVDWTERFAPGVPAPAGGVGAFDTVANRTLVFGSRVGGVPTSDTWSYGPVQPASIAPFGNGCAGSAGALVLRADGGSLPWLGDTLALAVEPTPANAPVLLALGFSNSTFGDAPLPVSLDALGMTGCSLLVSIDGTLLTFANGARADFAIAVPTTTALTGLQFFAQAAVADAAANPAGIVASNALAGRIGAK